MQEEAMKGTRQSDKLYYVQVSPDTSSQDHQGLPEIM